jgi:hypothetical protein
LARRRPSVSVLGFVECPCFRRAVAGCWLGAEGVISVVLVSQGLALYDARV